MMSRYAFLVASVLLLSGCAGLKPKQVTVNALAAPDALQYTKYYLMPSSEVQAGLEYDSLSGQLQEMLSQRGFDRVSTLSQAQAVILFGYQVGDARTDSYTSIVPQWGQTGYSSAYTTGNFIGGQYVSNTTYNPQYGVTGYLPVTNTVTTYPLVVSILAGAADTFGTHQVRQLWSTVVGMASSTPDIRSEFPIMLRAALPYIAADSGGYKTIPIAPTQ